MKLERLDTDPNDNTNDMVTVHNLEESRPDVENLYWMQKSLKESVYKEHKPFDVGNLIKSNIYSIEY